MRIVILVLMVIILGVIVAGVLGLIRSKTDAGAHRNNKLMIVRVVLQALVVALALFLAYFARR